MIETILGIIVGLAIALMIERYKKPSLSISIAPHSDQVHDTSHRRFLYIRISNRLPTRMFSWFLSRSTAFRAKATIEFLRQDGSDVFPRPMVARWSFSIIPPRLVDSNNLVYLRDIQELDLRDVYPGEFEDIDVAVKIDDKPQAFGFNNMSYLKGFDNPEWLLPQDRYVVKVTVLSADISVSKRFALRADWPRDDFCLQDIS